MAVHLHGELICADQAQADIVARYLPEHIELSRAEEGCLSFDVEATADPLVWSVREHFINALSFRAHQRRASASAWGEATEGIERCYTVGGLEEC